ncbi:hypothetical protein SAMN04487968_10866 [Nocardioides terrae]|uniref:Uncharacterized protein n=1 Tax=Nocardioides terrae TaxID=574651 RepID=A0A1I1KBL4_9ACTN|nr:hypothetical protein SAMN04487968_10866 [Nocardioides terrae]
MRMSSAHRAENGRRSQYRAAAGYRRVVKLMRMAVLLGAAKKAYDVASRPENQKRIKDAVAGLQARRARRAGSRGR